MNRTMLLGDTHANLRFTLAAIETAVRTECTSIVQLGDFGIWDHVPAGVEFLDRVNASLEANGILLVFADGNHENFDSLYQLPVGDDGFRPVRSSILHAPRGHIWTWSGVTFMAMGGAHSIDAWGSFGGIWGFNPQRAPGRGWWPQESITGDEVAHALTAIEQHGGPIDIMVAHDCPIEVAIPGIRGYPAGDANRQALSAVVEAADPQLFVCGHYHLRHTDRLRNTRVEILAHDQARHGNYLLVDLEPFRLVLDSNASR